jgi:hypothetical protein
MKVVKINNLVLVLLLLWFISPLHFGQDFDLDKYVKKSDIIVVGKVTDLTCKWDQNKSKIWTYVTIKSSESLKGAFQNKITIKICNGSRGKGIIN